MNISLRFTMERAVVGLVLLLAGCEASSSDSQSTSMSQVAAELDEPAATPAADETAEQPAAQQRPPAEQEPQAVTAKTPKRGQSLHDQGSYLSAVGSARFRAEHQMILNQVQHALKLYRAEHGEYPQSHEQFMSQIIEPNMISLPELEDGYEYWYDPDEPDSAKMLKSRPIESGDTE